MFNRLDVDARLLAASGVKLDRAPFPLLSRIAMNADMNVAELANIVRRDHLVVSRQIIKTEKLVRKYDEKQRSNAQFYQTRYKPHEFHAV